MKMEPRSLDFVCRACKGELISGSPEMQVLRVSTDSRQIAPGDVFFAIKGERFDGHHFLPEVVEKGASAVVVERRHAKPLNLGVVAVDDARKALGQFAGRYRQDFQLPIVAVAGSNGKTTTKRVVASV